LYRCARRSSRPASVDLPLRCTAQREIGCTVTNVRRRSAFRQTSHHQMVAEPGGRGTHGSHPHYRPFKVARQWCATQITGTWRGREHGRSIQRWRRQCVFAPARSSDWGRSAALVTCCDGPAPMLDSWEVRLPSPRLSRPAMIEPPTALRMHGAAHPVSRPDCRHEVHVLRPFLHRIVQTRDHSDHGTAALESCARGHTSHGGPVDRVGCCKSVRCCRCHLPEMIGGRSPS